MFLEDSKKYFIVISKTDKNESFDNEGKKIMHNILFISCNGIEDAAFGGPKGTIRNYEALKKYGKVYPLQIVKRSNIKSLVSLFEGYYPPVSNWYMKLIKKTIREHNIDIVFFDQSFYGNLVKEARKMGCYTIVFCHNCEADYNEIRFSKSNNLIKKIFYSRNIRIAEKKSLSSADKIAVFLKRDADRIYEMYKGFSSYIVPLGAKDKFIEFDSDISINEKYCLLLGPAYEANLEGARWFAANIAPYLKCITIIAGKGFDKHAEELKSEKIIVKGFVDDIANLYNEAFLVAIPQLIGSGMKVKTIEAMMFGKYIVGTPEAFAGFDIDLNDTAKICDTKEEFINAINQYCLVGERFNQKSRDNYLKYYSLESCEKQFDLLMEDVDK